MQIKTCVRWISQFVFAAAFLFVLLIQAGLASATQVPIISPSGGEYTSSETVTIGNIDSGDTAYYTTDGSNPRTSSNAVAYSGTFTVSQSEIIRAAIKDSSGDWGSVTTAVFIIDSSSSSSINAPTISPSGGEYTSSETVTIGNIDSGDTAYYTTDRSDPRTSSTAVAYSGTFTVSQSEIVLAAVKDSSGDWSRVTSARFIIDSSSSSSINAPTISPSGGKYTSSATVTISNYSDGTAYYTTDKSDPRTSSTATEYGGSFTVSESEIVLAAVKDSSGDWSSVTAARFIIDNSSNSNYDNNGSNTNYDNNDSNDSNNWYNGSGSGNRNGNRNQGLDYNINNWDKNLDKNW